jgi:hypothetical protein
MNVSLSRGLAGLARLLFPFVWSLPLALAAPAAAAVVDQLVVHSVTPGMPRNTDFTVRVRAQGQNWQELPAYLVKVAGGINTHAYQKVEEESKPARSSHLGAPKLSIDALDSSFVTFDFAGAVDVSITYNRGDIESTRIRPLSYGIRPIVKSDSISFSLSQPRNLSVEVNGDIFHNLQVFANPIEDERPNPSDPNVIFYGPGVHQIGRTTIASGKTVYLAGGALVEGSFLINHAENVRIMGRGILYQSNAPRGAGRLAEQRQLGATLHQAETPPQPATLQQTIRSTRRDAILIEYSRNVDVDGIIEVPNAYTILVGQSQNVTIRNIKSFSTGGNNDGIDVFTSSDVVVDGVFLRNSDDNIAIYGHRWKYYGDTRNVTVENSTLWADVAHPILVGTHGDSENPDTLEDLKFLNLDILDQNEKQIDYQGCMSLNAGDDNLIRNVRFENIRVEDFREGQLVNLRVFNNRKYNTSPGRGIENVLFRDITFDGSHANLSIIAGYDDTRIIKDVVFQNLKINETLIWDGMTKPAWFKTSDMAQFFVGEHVNGLQFQAPDAVTRTHNKQSDGR